MLSHGDKVVLGVSGGADSLALLHILSELREYNLNLTVAHLNHGIRGEEADGDSKFVEAAAHSLGLQFEYKKVDTIAYKEQSKLSLEDAARTLRYDFFNEVQNKVNASKVATAHTLDDQAETVLMRLLRGSGLRGLSGIPPVSRGYIIRPLLFVSRSEIEEYLKSKGVEWVEDSTNKSIEYLRNRLRLDLIPALENYNPQIIETLARTAGILRADHEFISTEAEKRFVNIFRNNGPGEFIGDLSKYGETVKSLRLSTLRLAVEKSNESLKDVSYAHITAADDFLLSDSASGEVELPEGTVIAKGYDIFLVTKKSRLAHQFSYTIESQGKWRFPGFEVEIELTHSETLDTHDESTVYFDPEYIEFPIQVRSFKPGDRFMPLGMKSEKKMQDYFTDTKVPRFLRKRVPIFISKGEIFWIGGMRIDERAKVKRQGQELLRFKLSGQEPHD